MTVHWLHVTAAWTLVLGGFAVLGVGTLMRHRAARGRLARLDPRGRGA